MKNAHQLLFIGSLEVLTIKPQKNRTKTCIFSGVKVKP